MQDIHFFIKHYWGHKFVDEGKIQNPQTLMIPQYHKWIMLIWCTVIVRIICLFLAVSNLYGIWTHNKCWRNHQSFTHVLIPSNVSYIYSAGINKGLVKLFDGLVCLYFRRIPNECKVPECALLCVLQRAVSERANSTKHGPQLLLFDLKIKEWQMAFNIKTINVQFNMYILCWDASLLDIWTDPTSHLWAVHMS